MHDNTTMRCSAVLASAGPPSFIDSLLLALLSEFPILLAQSCSIKSLKLVRERVSSIRF